MTQKTDNLKGQVIAALKYLSQGRWECCRDALLDMACLLGYEKEALAVWEKQEDKNDLEYFNSEKAKEIRECVPTYPQKEEVK